MCGGNRFHSVACSFTEKYIGSEHAATATSPAQPSYCTLPTFHAPVASNQVVGLGYVSNDGHSFSCRNPVVMQQAFHVYVPHTQTGTPFLICSLQIICH